MGRKGDFRSGQRVRIKSSADSDFAGYYGVIMHVGGDVCDVKIRYKPHGSKVHSTYIGTFHKSDLESLMKRAADLAMYEQRQIKFLWQRMWVWALLVLVILLLLFILLWI